MERESPKKHHEREPRSFDETESRSDSDVASAESFDIKKSVEDAQDIDEVIDIVLEHKIEGDEYSRDKLVAAIEQTVSWYENNKDEILVGVLNGGNESVRQELGDESAQIPEGFGLRKRVKYLLKVRMREDFLARREELIQLSIDESQDLDQLAKASSQLEYKKDERKGRKVSETVEEAIYQIRSLGEKGVTTLSEAKLGIKGILMELKISREYGLRDRVETLAIAEIQNKIKAQEPVAQENTKKQSFWSRLLRRKAA